MPLQANQICRWGRNLYGQSNAPVGLFTELSAGTDFNYAVDIEGKLQCWGRNVDNQSTPPTSAESFVQVSCGDKHACAVTDYGNMSCWGDDSYGQSSVPTGLSAISQVSSGKYDTCIIQGNQNQIYCWGCNRRNATCNYDDTYGLIDDENNSANSYLYVETGTHFACAMEDDGSLDCWGDEILAPQIRNLWFLQQWQSCCIYTIRWYTRCLWSEQRW